MWASNLKIAGISELTGRIDAYRSTQVENMFHLIPANVHAVVDLSGVSFVDSMGWSSLIRGINVCGRKASQVYLCGLGYPMRVICDLINDDKRCQIYDSVPEAMDAILRNFREASLAHARPAAFTINQLSAACI